MLFFESVLFVFGIKGESSDKGDVEELGKGLADGERVFIRHGDDRIGDGPFELDPLNEGEARQGVDGLEAQIMGGRLRIKDMSADSGKRRAVATFFT